MVLLLHKKQLLGTSVSSFFLGNNMSVTDGAFSSFDLSKDLSSLNKYKKDCASCGLAT